MTTEDLNMHDGKHLIIENPNSSGQGFNAYHAENPHHTTLTALGWKYSHTTPIRCVDGSRYAIHTYKIDGIDWNIGVNARSGWLASSSRGGSGRRTVFHHHGLVKYLKRKTRELKKAMA